MPSAANPRWQGFTLVELTIVMVIVALLLAVVMPATTAILTGQKKKTTIQKLSNIEASLSNFVQTNRRLPCPANGLANDGTEMPRDGSGDCTGNQASGVVPWIALGLAASDVLDGWDNRITYRVGYGLTRDAALDMSACDPAGTALTDVVLPALPAVSTGVCVATCTGVFAAGNCTSPSNFLAQKGLRVSNGAALLMDYAGGAGVAATGAAFVLVSHGQNGYGAISNTAVYQPNALTGVAGNLENVNRNLPALTVTNGAPPTFNDVNYSEVSDVNVYFDDILVRPTLMTVITRAQLGPRSH